MPSGSSAVILLVPQWPSVQLPSYSFQTLFEFAGMKLIAKGSAECESAKQIFKSGAEIGLFIAIFDDDRARSDRPIPGLSFAHGAGAGNDHRFSG